MTSLWRLLLVSSSKVLLILCVFVWNLSTGSICRVLWRLLIACVDKNLEDWEVITALLHPQTRRRLG